MNVPSVPWLQHLRDAQYDILQQTLTRLQQDFELANAGEHDLQLAFRAFKVDDSTLGEKFSAWLEAHPQSYVALTALASWLHHRGREMRGGGRANEVSDQGMRGMFHFFEQAEGAARHATDLTANPLSAWLVVSDIQNGMGCRVAQADVENHHYPDWYAEPLKNNPHSLALRRSMLAHLRTEWGGSEKQMLTFVRQQQDGGQLSQGDMQKLWAQYHAYIAHHAWLFEQDQGKALEHARLASDLNEAHAELLYGLLTDLERPAAERRAALERFVTELERHPENGLWYARSALAAKTDILGPVAERLGRTLAQMALQGDSTAAFTLGLLKYEAPGLGFPDPVPLLREARDKGSVTAAMMLMVLADQDRHMTRAEKQDHVLKAADLGNDHAAWVVYDNFDAYRKQFGLDDRARYRYLLRAADAGNNDARFALAQQLRAGFVEVGEDGVLRPVDTPPLQESLDYAKHLLERAAGEDHGRAKKELAKAKEADWQAKTAKRLKMNAVVAQRESSRGGMPWWRWIMWLWLFGVLVRSCGALLGD